MLFSWTPKISVLASNSLRPLSSRWDFHSGQVLCFKIWSSIPFGYAGRLQACSHRSVGKSAWSERNPHSLPRPAKLSQERRSRIAKEPFADTVCMDITLLHINTYIYIYIGVDRHIYIYIDKGERKRKRERERDTPWKDDAAEFRGLHEAVDQTEVKLTEPRPNIGALVIRIGFPWRGLSGLL